MRSWFVAAVFIAADAVLGWRFVEHAGGLVDALGTIGGAFTVACMMVACLVAVPVLVVRDALSPAKPRAAMSSR